MPSVAVVYTCLYTLENPTGAGRSFAITSQGSRGSQLSREGNAMQQQGFSLIELLMGLAIAAIVLLLVSQRSQHSLNQTIESRRRTR